MDRRDVINALHEGMAQAVRDFHAWTDESIDEWGVESLLTASCARALHDAIQQADDRSLITIEQSFAGIMAFSQAELRRGRKTRSQVRVDDKPGGRVDLVLWSRTDPKVDPDKPRAIVEIKRSSRSDGLVKDAGRVIDFINAAGRAYKGTVRYGLMAVLLQTKVADADTALFNKLQLRKGKLDTEAKKHGMVVDMPPARWVDDPHPETGYRTATVVFVLKAKQR
ncbi:MAG TPA: hypothetical protein VN157_07300 [Caulobacter sp.]|nr:hypothetical protein [Caulobacter sp.]